MKKIAFIALIIQLFLSSCQKEQASINGLWVIEKVKVGNEDMTPNGRWVRLNADSSQQSGNGWTQHSVGTWSFNKTNNTLQVINTNGYIDEGEPFKVSFEGDKMFWERTEEGENVKVVLAKAKELPQSYGDEILGVWTLTKMQEAGVDKTNVENHFLYMRWDKKFVTQDSTGNKFMGIYNVDGHRPEVEFIYNIPSRLVSEKWEFNATKDVLTMQRIVDGVQSVKTYTRTYEFPY